MHPLIGDISQIKDAELDQKISDLTKKYFMTHNPGVQSQISAVLQAYKQEQQRRQQVAWEKMMNNRDKNLDKLINVN